MLRIKRQHSLISLDRIGMGVRIFFKRDPLSEQAGNVFGRNWLGLADGNRRSGDHPIAGREIEHDLSGNGFEQLAVMTEGNSLSRGERSRFDQRICHARSLLLHGSERFSNHCRPHFVGTKVTNLLDLQEVKKGIAIANGYQFGFFPAYQLAGRDPKDPKQIGSSISVHGF
jgi:hypothetical protein